MWLVLHPAFMVSVDIASFHSFPPLSLSHTYTHTQQEEHPSAQAFYSSLTALVVLFCNWARPPISPLDLQAWRNVGFLILYL